VQTSLVNHPGPTVGYRVESAAGVLAYMPDHEPAMGVAHFPIGPDWTSGYRVARDADLLIHARRAATAGSIWKFTAGPLIASLVLSFTDFNLVRPEAVRFIGLDNYARMAADPLVLQGLVVTVRFAILAVPATMIASLGIALLVFGPKKLPELGKGLGEGIRGFKNSFNGGEAIPPTPVTRDEGGFGSRSLPESSDFPHRAASRSETI